MTRARFLPERDTKTDASLVVRRHFSPHSPVVCVSFRRAVSSKINSDHFLRKFIYFSRGEVNQLESSDLGRGERFPPPDGGDDDDGDDDSELFGEGL